MSTAKIEDIDPTAIAIPRYAKRVPKTIGLRQCKYTPSTSSFWVAITGRGVPRALENWERTVLKAK